MTLLIFQPAAHTAVAIAPNPRLMPEVGSLPGIMLGSLVSLPVWWGTQHPSPWTQGWAARSSLIPEAAEKTYISKNVVFAAVRSLGTRVFAPCSLVEHVSPHPCMATGLCICHTSTQELVCVGAPCSRHEGALLAGFSPPGWLGLGCAVWEEAPGTNLQLQRHFY